MICDLQMPLMDGLECVHQLRAHEAQHSSQHPERPRVYAVAHSANCDDPGTYAECRTAGFDQVAAKPLWAPDIAELCRAVSGVGRTLL